MKMTSRNIKCCWISVLLAYMMCIMSCRHEDSSVLDNDIKLHISLGSPAIEVATRGISDDPKNENNAWTIEELLLDGSRLYRVTLLIVDENKELVGMKDWNDDIKSTLPTEVTTTIRGLYPNTTYTMVAVANYSAYDTWTGLSDFPDLSGLTIGTNISTILEALDNYTLPTTEDDYLVTKNPQPLSLVQQFTTPAGGTLDVEGELLRTYARIRIEIANRSETQPLSVNSLKFGSTASKFGYKTEPIMPVSDTEIPFSDGNLEESSSDAITPFVPLTVPKLNDEAGNSKVAFDAYIYECRNEAGFEYSLNVGYPISTTTTKTVYTKGNGTYSPSSGLYMIGYGSDNRFLTASDNSLTTSQTIKTELDPTQDLPVIWIITKNNDNSYYLRSAYNDKYIMLSTSGVSLNNSSDNLYISSTSGYIRSHSYSNNNNNRYIYVKNNASVQSQRYYQTAFKFYPLTESTKTEQGEGTTEKDFTIPLQTLINGVPQTTSIIRRNDFINVLVTVSYNENYNTIDFHVTDWIGKEGNVEFN